MAPASSGRLTLASGAVFVALYVAFAVVAANKRNLQYKVLLDNGIAAQDELGLFSSAFESAQGPAKVLSGVVIDMLSPSWVLVTATALTGATNVAFSRAPGLSARLGLWALNGVVQAFAWPSLTSVYMAWFRDSPHRGALYAALSTSQNLGALLCPAAVAAVVAWWGWEASFWAPGLLAVVCAAGIAAVVRDSPAPTSAAAAVPDSAAVRGGSRGASLWGVIVPVVSSPLLWALAVSYAFNSLVRTAIVDWAAITLGEVGGGAAGGLAARCVAAYEVGGAAGGLLAGFVSDAAFGGRRAPVMALGGVGLAGLLGILACALLAGGGDAAVASAGAAGPLLRAAHAVGARVIMHAAVALPALYCGIGALAFATHVLNGLATRELAPPGAGSTAGGLVKCVAQTGAACAGYPIGLAVAAAGGWPPVLLGLAAAAVLSAVAVLPLWGWGSATGAGSAAATRPKAD